MCSLLLDFLLDCLSNFYIVSAMIFKVTSVKKFKDVYSIYASQMVLQSAAYYFRIK